jgi:DNA-binding LacI/PurR family transcriptional regulator
LNRIGVKLEMIIGVLTHPDPDLSSPYFSECLAGLGSVLSPAEWVVNPQISNTDGWILLGPSEADLEKVRQMGQPAVVVNGDDGVFPSVDLDNVGAARQVMDHLIRLGHRRIGFIAGKRETANARHREQGYRESLVAAAVSFDSALVEEGRFERAGGRRAMEKFLGLSVPPTAVFAANDHMALGAWDLLKEKNVPVPQKMALAGFDNIPAAAEAGLTSISQPFRDMAAQAAEVLRDWMNTGREPHLRSTRFPGRFIPRHSSEGSRR